MTEVYRDVTITRDTRDCLESLAEWMDEKGLLTNGRILRSVVAKWDANEATEFEAEADAA